MWLKNLLFTKQTAITILIMTLLGVKVYGQNDSVINRYFIIELGDDRSQGEAQKPPFTDPTLKGSILPRSSLANSYREDGSFLFALKTNLLFDAVSIVNAEVEFPVGERWSLAGEILFPWWTMDNHKSDSRRNRLQILNGNIEAKYWWGDRFTRPTLTGWFSGVYTGYGTYDIEHNGRGYQGDALFSVGVSGGYAHQINQRGDLRMEYTLGVGYMTTYYHYYHAEFCDNNHWHAVEYRKGRYKWFGPTRAKVSLVWLINCNVKR